MNIQDPVTMDKGMGYFNYPELYAQPLAVAVGVGSI